jgi:hypothetical protein
MVFPKSAVTFDDAFNLQTISRDQEGVDEFAQLSEGTPPVLFHVARHVQILIFTCHWSRYRHCGIDEAQVIDLSRLKAV